MDVTCDQLASRSREASRSCGSAGAAEGEFKPSRFNARSVNPHGSLLLYNSFSGARCVIPPRGVVRAQAYLSSQGFAGTLDSLGLYLLRKGYLVPASLDEMVGFDLKYGQQQYRNDLLQLILLSSEECNFRCIYCSQHFKRGLMERHVRRGVEALVRSKIAKLSALEVSWFGGEPMLGYEVIEELAPRIQALAREHSVRFFSHITTNGYLLTPDRSAAMVGWGIETYQITVDGDAVEHDRHRPLRGGGGTFEQIVDNVVAMANITGQFTVMLRVNFDRDNMDSVAALLRRLSHALAGDSRFQVAFHPVGKWGGPNDADLNTCSDRESVLAAERLNEQVRSAGLRPGRVADGLRPVPANVCYAARPYNFIIGADGKVMKCTVALDTEDKNIVGELLEDGSLELDAAKFGPWVRPHYQTDSTCRECFFVPVCQGSSCPLPRVIGGDRPCPPQKVSIQRTLQEALRDDLRDDRTGRSVRVSSAGGDRDSDAEDPRSSSRTVSPSAPGHEGTCGV